MTADVLLGLVLAAVLFLIGWWGRRNAAALVPPSLSAESRARKERELRRGAFALIGLGVLVFVGVLARLIFLPVG
jgi:hypothetical protein